MLSQLMEALVKSEQLFGFEQQHAADKKRPPRPVRLEGQIQTFTLYRKPAPIS